MWRWLRERQEGFWIRKGSRLRGARIQQGEEKKRRGEMREKHEEKGRRTLFWRPHFMRFVLFTSIDSKSLSAEFIFSFLILFSPLPLFFFLHLFCHSRIPNLLSTLLQFFSCFLFTFSAQLFSPSCWFLFSLYMYVFVFSNNFIAPLMRTLYTLHITTQ